MTLSRNFRRLLNFASSFQAVIVLLSHVFSPSAAAQSCGSQGIAVQVLGSGGPELQDKRASSSYLLLEDGQAKAVIDAGGGSALRFGESGAQMSQLDVLLFSHLHVDHSGDFAALIKSSWFEDRSRPLPRPNLSTICSATKGLTAISVSCLFPRNKAATKCSLTM